MIVFSGCNAFMLGKDSNQGGTTQPLAVNASQFHQNEQFIWARYRDNSADPVSLERVRVLAIQGSSVLFALDVQNDGQNWQTTNEFSADLEACVQARTNGNGTFQLGAFQRQQDGSWQFAFNTSVTQPFDDHFNCSENAASGTQVEQKSLKTSVGELSVARFAPLSGPDTGEQNWYSNDGGPYQGVSIERDMPSFGAATTEFVRLESVN